MEEYKFKIFHILASEKWTGPSDPALFLAGNLKKRGHIVYFACRCAGKGIIRNARLLGISPITHFDLGTSNNPLKYFQDLRKLQALLDLLKIDILHLHTSHDHLLGAMAARLCHRKVRVVRTHHKAQSTRADIYHRYLYGRLTDLNIVVSQSAKEAALAKKAIQPDMLRLVPGGVDVDRFRKGKSVKKMRLAHGLRAEDCVLALVSHVHSNRGHMMALESFEKIHSKSPDARLVFLGESDRHYHKFLVGEVQRRGLEKEVIFILDKCSDWVRLLDMIDIAMVLAVGSEGSARAVMESMALEKPVIGADVGAIPEIVQHGTSGLIVSPKDPVALAEAMHRLFIDKELRNGMGKAGRQIIESSFTNRLKAERMEKLYLEIQ